jgi:hypothetical protein
MPRRNLQDAVLQHVVSRRRDTIPQQSSAHTTSPLIHFFFPSFGRSIPLSLVTADVAMRYIDRITDKAINNIVTTIVMWWKKAKRLFKAKVATFLTFYYEADISSREREIRF